MFDRIRQCIYVGMIVVFVMLLWLPNMQRVLDIVPPRPLFGVVGPSIEYIPTPTIRSVIQEHFQKDFQDWFEYFLGFKTYAIRIDNTVRFALFDDVGTTETSAMFVGTHNYLYERAYIEQYIGATVTPQSVLIAQVQEMKQAKEILAGYGIPLLYIMAPTKPEVYPEFLTDYWKDLSDPERDYIRMRSLLEASDVSVYDAAAMLREYTQTQPYDVFTTGGTHWSYYGACLFLQEMIANEYTIFGNIGLNCDPPIFLYPPHGTDQDLAQLTNVWNTSVFTNKSAFPTVTKVGNADVQTVLIVGDSFVWTLLDTLEKAEVFHNRYFFYYNNSLYVYNKGKVGPVPTGDDWKNMILSVDVIMVETTHTALGNFGFGFLSDVVDRLE